MASALAVLLLLTDEEALRAIVARTPKKACYAVVSMDELFERLREVLRGGDPATHRQGEPDIEASGLRIDQEKPRVWKDGREVALSTTHYQLLLVLAQNAGRVVTHDDLILRVWGPSGCSKHNLRISVAALRDRIGDDPRRPRYIVGHRGVGYRFVTE